MKASLGLADKINGAELCPLFQAAAYLRGQVSRLVESGLWAACSLCNGDFLLGCFSDCRFEFRLGRKHRNGTRLKCTGEPRACTSRVYINQLMHMLKCFRNHTPMVLLVGVSKL